MDGAGRAPKVGKLKMTMDSLVEMAKTKTKVKSAMVVEKASGNECTED
jgi:hypothetical protein